MIAASLSLHHPLSSNLSLWKVVRSKKTRQSSLVWCCECRKGESQRLQEQACAVAAYQCLDLPSQVLAALLAQLVL